MVNEVQGLGGQRALALKEKASKDFGVKEEVLRDRKYNDYN